MKRIVPARQSEYKILTDALQQRRAEAFRNGTRLRMSGRN